MFALFPTKPCVFFTLYNAEEMKLSGKRTRMPDANGVKNTFLFFFLYLCDMAHLITRVCL